MTSSSCIIILFVYFILNSRQRWKSDWLRNDHECVIEISLPLHLVTFDAFISHLVLPRKLTKWDPPRIRDFSEVEHCSKHLGYCKYTLNKIKMLLFLDIFNVEMLHIICLLEVTANGNVSFAGTWLYTKAWTNLECVESLAWLKSQAITKSIKIYPEGELNVSTKFHPITKTTCQYHAGARWKVTKVIRIHSLGTINMSTPNFMEIQPIVAEIFCQRPKWWNRVPTEPGWPLLDCYSSV